MGYNMHSAPEPVPTGSHTSAPVQTGSNDDQLKWLSMKEAALHAHELGLSYTEKTFRKWSKRAHQNQETDELGVVVRQKDTPNGYRWLIRADFLDRRVQEERAHLVSDQDNSKPVPTGSHPSAPVQTGSDIENKDYVDANPPAPVQTGSHQPTASDSDFFKSQIDQKDEQIAELNKQIERKDDQIMTMLERDRETNILLQTLNHTLTQSLGLQAPKSSQREPTREGDSDPSPDIPHTQSS